MAQGTTLNPQPPPPPGESEPTAAPVPSAGVSGTETAVIELVRCANCHSKIPAQASQCRNCGRMRDARMDEATHRLARLAAAEEIKDDIRKWVKGHAWVTIGGLLLIGLGGGQLVELLAKNRVDAAFEDRVQSVVNAEIERLTAAAQQAEERFETTRSLMESLELQSASLLDNRRLLASRMDVLDVPSILPLNPRDRGVRYVPQGSLTFSWEDAEPVPKDGYTVELWREGSTERERVSSHFSRVTVRLPELGISPDCGILHWQVLRDGRPSRVFTCELYRSAWSRIEATGELRVGITSRETEGFLSFEDGEMVGVETEIVDELCGLLSTAMGGIRVEPSYRTFAWISLLQAPQERTADLVVSRITAKRARETAYGLAFSRSYHSSAQCLALVPDGATAARAAELATAGALDIARPEVTEFLRTLAITAVRGSTGADAVRQLNAVPRDGASRDQILERLRTSGGSPDQVHAALIDLEVARADPLLSPASEGAPAGGGQDDPLVYFLLDWSSDFGPRPEWLRDEYALAVAEDEPRLLIHLDMALSSWQSGR